MKIKRIFVVAFLSLYLFSTTEFHELFKLPSMVEHYKEHESEKSSITFWQFLCIHYAHGDVLDSDHDKDMKLPFKSHDNCSSSNFISLIPDHRIFLDKSTVVIVCKRPLNYYNEVIVSQPLKSIWQPPKIV